MKKLYVDTNIYIDYWEDRKDKMRPLGEFAFNLFKRTIQCEFMIFYSELIEKEICKVCNISEEECYTRFFKDLEIAGKLKFVNITNKILENAKKLKNEMDMPIGDIIHYLIAKENSLFFVTRDYHFNKTNIKQGRPEEL